MGAADVATFGGLCALAAFDRLNLKANVLENPTFRTAMEANTEVRACVEDFYNSRYSSLFDGLERLRPQLALDLHLHDHVDELYESIREKALVQYCLPFSAVDLRRMADAFRVDDVVAMEREVGALIADEQIPARIDSRRKTLHKRRADSRATTYADALEAGRLFTKVIHAQLLRTSLIRNECTVKGASGGVGPSRRGGGGGGGGGAAGAGAAAGAGTTAEALFRGHGRGFGGSDEGGHGHSRGGRVGEGRVGRASRTAAAAERDGGGDVNMASGSEEDEGRRVH